VSTTVMTGGSSGFGAIAAERLTLSGNARLVLGARRPTSLGESIPLDLTELDSVRAFATSVRERLGDTPVDALVLNAGVVLPDVSGRTVDGFETTFAVNHLAHYLLLRLLLPALADTAIVVLTTSGTYDPANNAGLATPRHADADLLAHPDRDPDLDTRPRKAGEHAYTASKLCAVLTARSLSERPEVQSQRLTVVAYDPGQVFRTGLAKDLSCEAPERAHMRRPATRSAHPAGTVGTGSQRRTGEGTLERQRRARRRVGLTRTAQRLHANTRAPRLVTDSGTSVTSAAACARSGSVPLPIR
jgi:NAD(P)-dependent dehydrogenase (short-subunit alcohol dehydrogenase family)